MMRHEAVIKLYPNVHNQVNDKAFDVNGNEILIDENAVNTEVSNMLSKVPMRLLREERNRKLQETDWWVSRGNMTTAQSNYRQKLRDIPQDYTASDYDALLEMEGETPNKKLKHAVWSKP